ncbi:hypothetical protein I4F81_005692 [Pyropia yezoensis]|uniref:Uncharacterized protein n=1 Tax=Pyropia yezoensis TaxID=2788 RepID=A0ACC3BYW2_PYRYE|nr:hypothetical protein I4F81_005692 [Neopyropia yezoensis]
MAGWTRLTAGLPTSLATRLRRRRLEAFKFSVYLLVPVGASYYFGSGAYPYLERIIQQRSYVVYPPEGPAPPAPDEMARLVGRERAREEARAVAAVAAATAADGGAGGGEGVGKPPRVQR